MSLLVSLCKLAENKQKSKNLKSKNQNLKTHNLKTYQPMEFCLKTIHSSSSYKMPSGKLRIRFARFLVKDLHMKIVLDFIRGIGSIILFRHFVIFVIWDLHTNAIPYLIKGYAPIVLQTCTVLLVKHLTFLVLLEFMISLVLVFQVKWLRMIRLLSHMTS